MDFNWTPEQARLRDDARAFAREHLNDRMIERDRSNEFSRVLWKKSAEFGLPGLPVPEALGGRGLNALDIMAVFEGIGFGCRDNGLIFAINAHLWGCLTPILRFGNEEQKERLLPGLCNGETIGANAMTEPGSGSNVYGLSTTARADGDRWILNGAKTYVTNGPAADVFTVYAKTGDGQGMSAVSCFLVERGFAGVRLGANFDKMGLRTCGMSDLVLENCPVPSGNLLGKPGSGGIVFNDSMDWERVCILAGGVGSMDRQVEECVHFASRRKPGQQPISKFQSISHRIADMKVRLEAGRLLLYRAASIKSQGKQALMESAMAKLFVSEAYVQNSRDAMQIHGGRGYLVESELERDLRDALASTLYSGTSEIQKNIIAGWLGA